MAFFTGFFPIFYYEENRLPGQSLFPSAPYAKLESQNQQGGICHMEFRVLKYFLMVAREENITHAAELLHITQPTLSRQLIQLEEELGVKLFQRSKHRIVLTEEGILLRRRAEELVALSEKTIEDIRHKDSEILAGTIMIGSGEFKTSQFLAELISSFHEKYPQVQFELYSGNADNIKERLDRGLLDIGLLGEPVDISKYHFARTPFKESWGVLVREDSVLAGKTEVTPEDLVRFPVIMTQRESVKNEVLNWFGDYADQIKSIAAGNLLYNLTELARCGLGSIITIQMNCAYAGLRFIPFSPRLEAGTVLVWKKGQIFSQAAEAFIQYAKEYLAGIYND